jgi:hypothetical protein
MLLVGVVAVAAVVLVTVLGTRPHERAGQPSARREQGSGAPPRTAPRTAPAPMPLGIVGPDGILAQLDPRTLQPRRPELALGEYHNAWSFAPDGTQLAVAISSPGEPGVPVVGHRGRIGIRIIDARRMTVVRDISTGIAAEALGWLAPGRLVALLQSGELVVVDPVSGAFLRRWEVGSAELLNPPWARTRDRLLVLIDSPPSPRLAVVDSSGRLRMVALGRQQHGCCGPSSGHAGLAVDATGGRAFVVAAEVPVAEVDLKTMAARYHPVATPAAALLPSPGTMGQAALWDSHRAALWLNATALAVSGEQFSEGPGGTVTSRPAGVAVIDTRSWGTHVVAPGANRVCAVGGRLLAYREELAPRTARGVGLGLYDLQGRPLLHLLGDEAVIHVEVWGGQAYVYSPTAVRVVDPRSGRVVRTLPTRGDYVELLGGLCGP